MNESLADQIGELDSRRSESRPYQDWLIRLEDHEALVASPERLALVRLRQAGFTEVVVAREQFSNGGPPSFWIEAILKLPAVVVEGKICLHAEITSEDERVLRVDLDSPDEDRCESHQFRVDHLDPEVWVALESILRAKQQKGPGLIGGPSSFGSF